MKDYLKKYSPKWIKALLVRVKRLLVYNQYDSSTYWKNRASDPGQAAVLWQNQEYNKLYRKNQFDILYPHIRSLQPNSRVLDIGCGIGVVTEMMLLMNKDCTIDGVDFEEMVSVAKKRVVSDRVCFIASPAESYLVEPNTYDFILSSGCYSAIRDIQKLERALSNASEMLKPCGKMIMIDPFHRWNYLARVKYHSQDVVRFMKPFKIELENKSGVLFWPFRDWLANSKYTGKELAKRFYLGERLLAILGKHLWADYKILVFRKHR